MIGLKPIKKSEITERTFGVYNVFFKWNEQTYLLCSCWDEYLILEQFTDWFIETEIKH